MNEFRSCDKNLLNPLSIKSEIEIKEEPQEAHEEYLTVNGIKFESSNHQKEASEIFIGVLHPEKPCSSNFFKIEEPFDEVHDTITEDNDYDVNSDIDVKNEDIEELIEDPSQNLSSDIILERNYDATKGKITNEPKRRAGNFDFPSPISSSSYILEQNNEGRMIEGNKIIDIGSRKGIKLDEKIECPLFSICLGMDSHSEHSDMTNSQKSCISQSVDISLPADEDQEIPLIEYLFKDCQPINSELLNDKPIALELVSDKEIFKINSSNVSYQKKKGKKNVKVSKTKTNNDKSSQKDHSSGSEYFSSSDDEDDDILGMDTNISSSSASLYDNLNLINKNETSPNENKIGNRGQGKITVGTSSNTKEKRAWGKKMRCYYCDKYVTNISKHYLLSHSKKEEVAGIIALPAKCTQRKNLLSKLRNLGNFKHNANVIKNNKGELIVARRPSKKDSKTSPNFEHFIPCKYCYAFLKKQDIRRHGSNCPFNDLASNKGLLTEGIILLHEATSPITLGNLEPIFETMRKDDVFYSLKNDDIILKLGSLWATKLKGKLGVPEVNQKMRELSRLLMELNKDKQDHLSLCQYLDPSNFDYFISAVENLTFHTDSNKPKALALKLGHSIKRCCSIKVGMAIRKGDNQMRKDAEDFLTLFNNEYNQRINAFSLRSLYDAQRHLDVKVPLTEDIIKFSTYLEETVSLNKEKLEKSVNIENWFELAQITLCRITIFNKRRGGEASGFLLSSYQEKLNWSIHQNNEIYKSLSSYEQHLCKRLDLVRVKGKRGKRVPIILTPEVKGAIDLLIITRKVVGIPEENPYVFANASNKYFRAWETIKKYGTICSLKDLKSMTSPNLRKYIATCSQILALSKNELEWLAKHLGHDITVHRQYYRLSDSALELAKVSKLLIASETSSLHKVKNLNDGNPTTHIGDTNNMASCNTTSSSSPNNDADALNDFDKNISGTQQNIEPTVSEASEIENMEPPRKRRRVSTWSLTDKENLMKHFKQYIQEKKAPGKKECTEFLEKFKLEIDWRKVKDCIKNTYYKRK